MNNSRARDLNAAMLHDIAARLNEDHVINDETARVSRVILRDPELEPTLRDAGYVGGPLFLTGKLYGGGCLLAIVFDSHALTLKEALCASVKYLADREDL